MPFLSPNQQRESTEGNYSGIIIIDTLAFDGGLLRSVQWAEGIGWTDISNVLDHPWCFRPPAVSQCSSNCHIPAANTYLQTKNGYLGNCHLGSWQQEVRGQGHRIIEVQKYIVCNEVIPDQY